MNKYSTKEKPRQAQANIGDVEFKRFVTYIHEHKALPDMSINGNMGVHHNGAVELVKMFNEGGYDDFAAALKTLQNVNKDANRALSTDTPEQPVQVGTLLSDVQPEAIHWLWPGRLAVGKMEMFDGDPGLGKTTLCFDMIARLTTGRNMPYESGPATKGGAVLICLEDGLADTIQPRLAKAGADLSKVVSIGFRVVKDAEGNEYDKPFDLAEDREILEAAIKRVDAKIILIDPLMGILGGKDTYKDNDVRASLAPLKALAERYGATVVCIRHNTKAGGDKLIFSGGGSIAFIGLARIGLMAMQNPSDETQGIFLNPKNNLSIKAPKLLYRIISDIDDPDRPYVQWEGITTISEQELTAKPTNVPGEGRQAILKCLKENYPEAMTPQQIADELAPMSEGNIKMTLRRMVESEQIQKSARGLYSALSSD